MLVIRSRPDSMISDDPAFAPGDAMIVDIDSFDHAALDRLLVNHAIEAPYGWEGWTAQGKIGWLKYMFGAPADPAAKGLASAKGASKVSLMSSLAALANPVEGKLVQDDNGGGHPAVVRVGSPAWEYKNPSVVVAGTDQTGQLDPLRYLVDEIENLDEQDALGLVGKLANQGEVTSFRLGGVLAHLKANGWRNAHGSFKEFVEVEHGIAYRKAARWMGVYRQLAESKVPWEKVQKVGWTKLKEIAGVITPDNVDEWVKVAAASKTSTLTAIVASHKRAGSALAIEHRPVDVVTKMTFRVNASQKGAIQAAIDKAKTLAGAPAATVALESICADYLSGATFSREAKTMGLDACVKVVEQAFPNARIQASLAA
jgi:hypothetical protein